jgi:hypothetical protein
MFLMKLKKQNIMINSPGSLTYLSWGQNPASAFYFIYLLFIYCSSTGGWTQDLTLAVRVLYNLSQVPAPFV